MIPLVKPYMPPREELMLALEEILYSGYIATGQAVYEFEDQFKDYIDNPNMISLHSGISLQALSLVMKSSAPQ